MRQEALQHTLYPIRQATSQEQQLTFPEESPEDNYFIGMENGEKKEVRYDKDGVGDWTCICDPICVKQFSDEEFQ